MSGSDSDSDHEENSAYVPGGYHPVQLGEIYKDRYLVERKLGYGHFSTVWLASDISIADDDHPNKLVALKIQKSAQNYHEAALDEIRLLNSVKDEAVDNSLSQYVVQLLDEFTHIGPHGTHVCLVFEPMGKNILRLIKHYDYRGMPTYIVKIMTRQLLQGLDFLHRSCRIIHTDLKPENFLMLPAVPFSAKLLREQRESKLGSPSPPPRATRPPVVNSPGGEANVHALEGMPDPHGVVQLINLDLDPIELAVRRFSIKISDLGNGCWIDHHFTEDIATRQYRSPEVIVGLSYTESADIWATACIIFELLTAEFLFDPREDPNGIHSRNEDHLALIRELLGPFPTQYVNEGVYSKKYFNKKGDFVSIKELHEWPLTSVLSDKYGMSRSEADCLANTLLLPMLNLNHIERITARDAALSPWLNLTPVDLAAMYFDAGQIERLPLAVSKAVLEYEALRVGEVQAWVEKTRYTPTRMDRYIRKLCPYHIWIKETYGESIVEAIERIDAELVQIDPLVLEKQQEALRLVCSTHDTSYLRSNVDSDDEDENDMDDKSEDGDAIGEITRAPPVLAQCFTNGSTDSKLDIQGYVDDEMHLVSDDERDDKSSRASSEIDGIQHFDEPEVVEETIEETPEEAVEEIIEQIQIVEETVEEIVEETVEEQIQQIVPEVIMEEPAPQNEPQPNEHDVIIATVPHDIIQAEPEEDEKVEERIEPEIIIIEEQIEPENDEKVEQQIGSPEPEPPSRLLPIPPRPSNPTHTQQQPQQQPHQQQQPSNPSVYSINRPKGSLVMSRLSLFEHPAATTTTTTTTTTEKTNNHPPAKRFSPVRSTHSVAIPVSTTSVGTISVASNASGGSTGLFRSSSQHFTNLEKQQSVNTPVPVVNTQSNTGKPAPSRVSTLAQMFESMSKK
jgi:serine/threonine-protein kinase SRPK3